MGFYDEDDESEYFKADGVPGLKPGGILRRSPSSASNESPNRKWQLHGRNGWQFLHGDGSSDFERVLVALLDRMYETGDL